MRDIISDLIYRNAEPFSAQDLKVEGEIPSFVRGNYYLNGPSWYNRSNVQYNHWLEGDAMVRNLEILDGKVNYKSQYLQSRKHLDEHAENKAIYRGFATTFEGDQLDANGLGLEGNINVSAYRYKDRLVAFGENALPLELDPETLNTKGQCTFDGALNVLSPFAGHPRYDARTKSLCNFGVRFLGKRGMLHYYEFDEDLKIKVKGSASMPLPACMHDFAISGEYACFYVAPYVLDLRGMKGGASMYESLRWLTEEETVLMVMSRKTGKLAARIPLDRNRFCLHLVNAFDRGNELVVDLMEAEAPFFDTYFNGSMFEGIRPNSTLRVVVDTKTWERKSLTEIPNERHLDFPSINRAQTAYDYRHYWILGMPIQEGPKFYTELLRFDWDKRDMGDCYRAPEGWVLSGEPALAVDPGNEDQAVVIIQMHELASGDTSYAFFDAFDLKAGPLGKIPLHQNGAVGFHSVFMDKMELG